MKHLYYIALVFLLSCTCDGDFRPDPGAVQFSWPVSGYVFQGFYGNKVSGEAPGLYWDEHDTLKSWNGPGRMHRAIDIDNLQGVSVVAAAGGVAHRYQHQGDGYGNYVIVDHGNGYWTLYAHLKSISVAEGAKVSEGDELGLLGSTGNSTGPHLHFEIRYGAQQGFPYYLPGEARSFVKKGCPVPRNYPKSPR